MPVSPNNLVEVLIEVVNEANMTFEWRQSLQDVVVCVAGVLTGAMIGGWALGSVPGTYVMYILC